MKKYIILFSWVILLGLTACFDDDSSLPTQESKVNAITIEEIKDTSAIAYATVLEITPQVSGYAEEELSYNWYIYGGEYDGKTPEGYRTVKIGTEKKLSFPVNLKIGNYQVVCEVTHNTSGYFSLTEFTLEVTSSFSKGFYILKETAGGDTDLDFFNNTLGDILRNVITSTQGQPLTGSPRNMNTVFNKCFVDAENAQPDNTTCIFVASGQHDFAIYSTIDMTKLFDRSNLLYSEMEDDEVPYAMATNMMNNCYFSNKGVRFDPNGMGWSATGNETGQLGFPEFEGASTFVQAYDGQNLCFWNEAKHRLYSTSGAEIVYTDGYSGVRVDWEHAQPVATGWNSRGGENTIWYLFDATGEGRYLVLLKNGLIEEVRPLEASSHLAQATVIAGNGKSSASVYAVHENQIYRYSLTEGTETSALTVTDLPDGNITYVANLFYTDIFDYLVIGTQEGEAYTISMYEMAGGQPNGKPVHSITGSGSVKKVCYACPDDSFFNGANFYAFMGMTPDFPY